MTKSVTPNGFELDNSGQRVVVDPITRIEGHLRIEVNLDENNVIRNAVSTGNMWRGLEVILKGRDPRDAWAFVERICGVCTEAKAWTPVHTPQILSTNAQASRGSRPFRMTSRPRHMLPVETAFRITLFSSRLTSMRR